jgi:hypothetical protein
LQLHSLRLMPLCCRTLQVRLLLLLCLLLYFQWQFHPLLQASSCQHW